MAKYKTGDKVVFIPRDYSWISKNFFLYPQKWKASNPDTDTNLMLGGKYVVLDTCRSNGYDLYKLLNSCSGIGTATVEELASDDQAIYCPFKVGDTVVANPKTKSNSAWMETCYESSYFFSDKSKLHVIREVLNDYYIFLDYDRGHGASVPLIWEDFEKVD